ncbi:hypothetical protein V5739_12165 [Salinimicrobium sp. TIG7-5_MAKvit]|uniref:hypothetical protein n=1 Tax=Salinimicrobium sp. TIG7-5_MAKvit TaxID=3121289 RepID=UPI003C6E882E
MATNPAGTILWQSRFGGDHIDAIKKTIELADGTYLLAGESHTGISGDKNEALRGFRDLWIVKLDANRQIEWQRTFGGNEAEDLTDVVQTEGEGFLIAAHSLSSNTGDKTTVSLGETDLWILKLDSSGNIEWQKSYGGGGYDSSPHIAKTNNGNFVIGATSASGISATKSELSRGLGDYWVFEIDPMGEIIWQRTIGGNNGDFFSHLQPARDGGYLLGGDSFSPISGEKTVANNGGIDLWVIKIDAGGEIQWQQTYGGSSEEWFANF